MYLKHQMSLLALSLSNVLTKDAQYRTCGPKLACYNIQS